MPVRLVTDSSARVLPRQPSWKARPQADEYAQGDIGQPTEIEILVEVDDDRGWPERASVSHGQYR